MQLVTSRMTWSLAWVAWVAASSLAGDSATGPDAPAPTAHPTILESRGPKAPKPGVEAAELGLEEIFRRPIGPRGLEYSEKVKALAGQPVRIRGHMVRQTAPVPFTLLLAPLPVQMHEREYGLADDLPANTVQVIYARGPMPVIPFARGPLTVEGTLELGPVEQADGRVSHVRVRCAAPWLRHTGVTPPDLARAPRTTPLP